MCAKYNQNYNYIILYCNERNEYVQYKAKNILRAKFIIIIYYNYWF